MVGTLSGVSAIGTGVYPDTTGEGTLATGGGGPTFVPTSLIGCTVWLDAEQLGLAADASLGSAWPNLGSGGAGTVVASPAPVIKMNAPNGKPVVRFKANEGRIRGNGMCVDGSVPLTVMYVGRMWNNATNVGRMFSNAYPPYNFLVGAHVSADNVLYDNGWAAGSGIGYGWNGYTYPSPWKLYGAVCTSAPLSTLYVDGVEMGSTNTSSGHGTNWNLSGYEAIDPGETCDCEVAELICYDRALSPAERVQVEEYLHDKWFEEIGSGGGPGILPIIPKDIGVSGVGTLSSVRVPGYLRGASLTGPGTLTAVPKQIYAKSTSLEGAGVLSSDIYGTGFKDIAAVGDGVLVGSGFERYTCPLAPSGDGVLALGISEIQRSPGLLDSRGILTAEWMPNTQVIVSTVENTDSVAGTPIPASATAGVYLTMVGKGGKGGNGDSGTSGICPGGGGGGGGGRIMRCFIPRSAMGSTFSLTRGMTAGQASSFISGSVSVAANAGGAGSNGVHGVEAQTAGGVGGTTSVTGVTGVVGVTGAVGGKGGTGTNLQPTAGGNATNGAGAGGGGAAGIGSNGATGQLGSSGGSANFDALDGAGGKGGNAGNPGGAGTAGSTYGGGGGGGAAGRGSGGGAGAAGGDGYIKVEWVGNMVLPVLFSAGQLSTVTFPQYQRSSALTGGGTLAATMVPANVTFNSVGAGGKVGNSTGAGNRRVTWSHANNTGDYAVVIFEGQVVSGTYALTDSHYIKSVTFGGVAMTLLGHRFTNNNLNGAFLSAWGLADPPQGTQTINADIEHTVQTNWQHLTANSMTYNDARSAVFLGAVSGTETGTTMSQTVASSVGKRVVNAFTHYDWTIPTGYTQTSRYSTGGSPTFGIIMGDAPGAASIVFTSSRTSGVDYAGIAVELGY